MTYITEGSVDIIPRSASQQMLELLGDNKDLSNRQLRNCMEQDGYRLTDNSWTVLAAKARRKLGIRRVQVRAG